MRPFTATRLLEALQNLDRLLPEKLVLLVGGGGAMITVYGETEATHDVDAVPIESKLSFDDLKPYLVTVAEQLDLSKDWINPYFGSYTHLLPKDYRTRTREFYRGTHLTCLALGMEDLLVMKLMAGRKKDDRHIRRLMKRDDIVFSIVEKQLELLSARSIPKSAEALERFDEFRSDLGIS